MRLDLDARLTASEAAALVNVSKQTFNHWRRYLIATDGTYRYGDVLEVERRMRNSPRSSRGAARRRLQAA